MNKWTRRTVIATGGLIGGGLALGVAGIAFAPNRLRVVPDNREGTPQLTTWVKIGADNTVSVIVPHCEMGTGVHTALAMMCAEELEADWSQVRVEEAPGTDDYANGYLVRMFVPVVASVPKYMERGIDFWTFKLTQMMDLQVTGGSSAVRGTGHLGMRLAGAAAKAMLVEAAAKQWNVPVAECSAKLSRVTHAGLGPHAHVRRACAAGCVAQAAGASAAQVARRLHDRRQADAANRHPVEGQWLGDLRRRRDAAADAVRDHRRVAGVRRQARVRRHCAGRSAAGREESREARQRSRSGGRWLLARAERRARARAEVRRHGQGRRDERHDLRRDRRGARRREERQAVLIRQGRRRSARRGESRRSGVSRAVPRARDDGADERHGAHRRRSLRSVDRRAGSARRAQGRGRSVRD